MLFIHENHDIKLKRRSTEGDLDSRSVGIGREGASIWCGHGTFTHSLVKIGALAS